MFLHHLSRQFDAPHPSFLAVFYKLLYGRVGSWLWFRVCYNLFYNKSFSYKYLLFVKVTFVKQIKIQSFTKVVGCCQSRISNNCILILRLSLMLYKFTDPFEAGPCSGCTTHKAQDLNQWTFTLPFYLWIESFMIVVVVC